MRILLAEQDRCRSESLYHALTELAPRVDRIDESLLSSNTIEWQNYEVLLLSVDLLPLMDDGESILRHLRGRDIRLPILVLAAGNTIYERVAALNEGADDFLSKPVNDAELHARVCALVRRSRGGRYPRLQCGPLSLNVATRQFTVDGEPIELSPREHAMLTALILHSGEVLSKAYITSRIFPAADVHPKLVEVIVHRLRRRLATRGVEIVTVRGQGYRLVANT